MKIPFPAPAAKKNSRPGCARAHPHAASECPGGTKRE